MNIYAGCFQDSTFLKKYLLKEHTSEWLLTSNLHCSLVEHFIVSSLFQFLMTSSKFTEHFPGSNKVHFPICDRKDFTLVLRSVVGQQNYINIWCIIILICFSLKMFFVTGDKSAGIFCGLVQISEWNS